MGHDHKAMFHPGEPAPLADAPCVELVLEGADGAPWVLRMSPGAERFIGYYPRLGGISSGGPLLAFRMGGAPGHAPGETLALPDSAFDDDEDIWPALPSPPRNGTAPIGDDLPSPQAASAGERMQRLAAALRRRLRG